MRRQAHGQQMPYLRLMTDDGRATCIIGRQPLCMYAGMGAAQRRLPKEETLELTLPEVTRLCQIHGVEGKEQGFHAEVLVLMQSVKVPIPRATLRVTNSSAMPVIGA